MTTESNNCTLHLPNQRRLSLAEPVIMGILNVTPDSFSDGGQHCQLQRAVSHAMHMLHDGASIIDIGGESTRPGAQRVDGAEQIRRTVPVIEKLRQANRDVVISIDTTLGEVARAALDAGADMINDVSAGEEDSAILALAAVRDVPIVLMHKQGMPVTMQDNPSYGDVVKQVHAYLLQRAQAAREAGVRQIILDPGIGFGKTMEHNMALLATLDVLVANANGCPVLLGTSRKSSLRSLCTMPAQPRPEPHELVGATCATTALGVAAGVQIFRVHDVQPNWQALRTALAIKQARHS